MEAASGATGSLSGLFWIKKWFTFFGIIICISFVICIFSYSYILVYLVADCGNIVITIIPSSSTCLCWLSIIIFSITCPLPTFYSTTWINFVRIVTIFICFYKTARLASLSWVISFLTAAKSLIDFLEIKIMMKRRYWLVDQYFVWTKAIDIKINQHYFFFFTG